MADNAPSDLELQLLALLWERGSGTVRELMDDLHAADGKTRGYTSVLTAMQSMERKKLVKVKRPRGQRAFVYSAKRPREAIVGPMLSRLVGRVFGGDPALAVQQLIDASEVDAESIARMRMTLDDAEKRLDETG